MVFDLTYTQLYPANFMKILKVYELFLIGGTNKWTGIILRN